jgi:CheY-like chemotaxis protein
MAKLFVVTQGLAVSSHDLGAEWVTIGRGDGNSFQVVEPSISGRHCEVHVRGNELAVRDLLSTNGTFIGGKKITEGVVKAGETLKLGDVEFRFEPSPPALPGKSPTVSAKPSAKAVPVTSVTAMPSAPSRPGSEADRRFHVLFVDDSLAFLEAFTALCTLFSQETWKVHSATSADRALTILQDQPIDLAVLDIGMPMVDGIQLLGIVHRRYPGLKIAVMTGHATESNRAACLASGAELFIEKPVSADGQQVVFNLLHDLVSWAHKEGFSGALREVGLQEVVQMECVGGHSSILEIRNTQLRGQIYVEAGNITHAEVGSLVGKQAFYRLLSLKGGEFQVKAFQAPPERTVHDRWEMLLMDAARASDEETVMIARSKSPPDVHGTAIPAPRPAAGPANHGTALPGDEYVVVATYDGKWIPAESPKKTD